ncbi:hypothetical protein [Nocardiopsis protaetiae]|uniref:hypothetical protein n=1 Tax=Nocardiopsis protaetiae TaxID=3382270 RepID=UPI00387AB5B6
MPENTVGANAEGAYGWVEDFIRDLEDWEQVSLFHPEGAGHSPVPVSLKPF